MGPETALIVAAVASTAAAAAAGASQYAQAKAAEASAEYDAEIAGQNATIARAESGIAEEQQRRQARVVLSNQRAAATERGIDLASSSAWDIYRQSAMAAEEDALTIRRKGEMAARGFGNEASASRFNARQARQGAAIGAGASLLAVGASAASGYSTYASRPGAGGSNPSPSPVATRAPTRASLY